MSAALDRAVSITLVAGTIAIAGSVVYRNFVPSNTVGTPVAEKPGFEPSWTGLIRFGSTILGDSAAPITIVEFTDLECPACRGFQTRLRRVVERHPKDVRVVYLAYPLSIHRVAMGAAQAGDCALEIAPDALARWVDVMYAGQDSLGLRSWGSYATEAGIADTAAIALCATNPVRRTRVDSSLASGQRLEINGTPTILVNGWLFRGIPSDRTLDDFIIKLLGGTAPRSSSP
jgi:protein-disulfide isomerase